jgi:hypothetical protein
MHVMHVMHVMMMVMVMMVVMMHWRGHRSGRRSSGFLRDGISGEAKRENGRGRKGLDHGKVFLCLREPQWVIGDHRILCLNSK